MLANKNVNTVALPRAGTKCQFCCESITKYTPFISCNGGAKGSIIFGHIDCCKKRKYSHKVNDTRKKKTYSGFQWAPEFETNQVTNYEERLFLYANYGIVCTVEGTVSEEFKTEIQQGLHGTKTWLTGIYNIVDIASGDNCGTHANVSLSSWSESQHDFYGYSTHYAKQIFSPLSKILLENEKQTIENFGRFFGSYRGYTEDSFVHGSWLNIKNNCLEFRLAKFQSVNQYFYLLCFLKEVCLIIEKYFLSSPCDNTAEDAGRRIVKAYEKHTSKAAVYYRPERNK